MLLAERGRGGGGGALQPLANLSAAENVVDLRRARGGEWLKPNTEYEWRVDHISRDVRDGSGLVAGAVWSFTTLGVTELSCGGGGAPPAPPSPPPSPPAPSPLPVECGAALQKLCPHEAGKAATCRSCIKGHSVKLGPKGAGCWAARGEDDFTHKYCHGGA